MTVSPGEQLGCYQILSLLGSGGMGEVFRARDTKLGREVALKILPEAYARDPERVARFEREARVLASLNHPNIAAIYGTDESRGLHFLVLELVLGETLRERVAKAGPLPVDEVLAIGKQIAEALEAAQAKNVVHRDLKPANVKLTPEGQVKVLDFGLAKAFAGDAPDVDPRDLPTGSLAGTLDGVILGTPAYMSPEQASGKKADKRTDIWALGCILYELLTGKQTFPGETVTEILAGVLRGEPDWNALPAETGPNVLVLLKRCLRKDLKGRFHDPADVRIAMEEALIAPSSAEATAAKASTRLARRWALLSGVACLVVAAITGLAVWNLKPSPPQTAQAPAHLVITLPAGDRLGVQDYPPVALSPDGNLLAYVATHNGIQQLFLRAIDSQEAKPISGTEGAVSPFFSPDGEWIGFFAGPKMKKVSIAGGAPQTLCDSATNRGASWGSDDTIVFAPSNSSGLWRVSAAGGKPQELTKVDRTQGELGHRHPEFLPGGNALLFTVFSGPGWDESHIAVLRLDTGERRVVLRGGHTGRFVPTGHLVYYRAGTLLAVPFDPVRLEVTSSAPVTIADGVAQAESTISAKYSFSAAGSLAYIPASLHQFERRLVWVDRQGKVEPLSTPPRPYDTLALSPDGRQVAVAIISDTVEPWIHDLTRGTLTRLNSEGTSRFPIWTPDGKRITYQGNRAGFRTMLWRAADGTGSEERLARSENFQVPGSWSPDGKWLAFRDTSPTTGNDIWMLRVEGDRKPQPFLQTAFAEWDPIFSPDGRWLAYSSDESGRFEVYVQPFPGPGGKWQISTEGGNEPRWARNGRELFYRNGGKMMVVDIKSEPAFRVGKPRFLFEGQYGTWDVAPDGQRFLMIQAVEPERPATQINVVLNWFEELKRRVPGK